MSQRFACVVGFILAVLSASATAVTHSETFVAVDQIAFWRFEDTAPAAYWRHELVLADHSGHDNHLGFKEPTNEVRYDNSLDGSPAASACSSETGSGCTYLEYDGGYDTDKTQRADWVAYDGAYRLSSDVPPLAMFHERAAPEQYTISVRSDLYTVADGVMPAGAGLASFDPGSQHMEGVLYRNGSTSLVDDFTVEGFFRTNGDQSDVGRMVLVEQSTRSSHFAYAVDLNADTAGALRFGVGNQNGSELHDVQIAGDFCDGQWHYFVVRYNAHAYGAGSLGVLTAKTLSEDGTIRHGLSNTPTHFEVASSEEALTLGGDRHFSNRFNGTMDEIRLSQGLVTDEDLLGLVGADYSTDPVTPTCSGSTTLTDTMATFGDGSGTAEYSNNVECTWLLQPPSPHTDPDRQLDFIALTFSAFSTEPTQDVVEVYDGDSTSAPLLGVFSGYNVPATPIISSGGTMLVRFMSDGRQSGQQAGFTAEYVSMSMSETACATANEGHTLNIDCSNGYVVTAINFASYGTPEGFCSNGAGAGVGALADSNGHVFNDNSNANGVGDGDTAGDGATSTSGPVVFNTGYCHADTSRSVVETACLGQSSCSLAVSDATFGGDNPCANLTDSTPSNTTDLVDGEHLPYFHEIGTSKRLFVQATCEGVASFASNCAEECVAKGTCLYALSSPYCDHCTVVGLNPVSDGSYYGEGCGSVYCVGEATCTPA